VRFRAPLQWWRPDAETTNINWSTGTGSEAGAVFIGNMESDITANGMMSFLKESLIERSDGPAFPVHMIQGHHEIADVLKPVCPASRRLMTSQRVHVQGSEGVHRYARTGFVWRFYGISEDGCQHDEDIVYE
jgi:hypothetical protein